MKTYLVIVSAELPYIIKREYTIKASGMHVAVSRGIKKFKSDINELKGKVKKIKAMSIKVTRL